MRRAFVAIVVAGILAWLTWRLQTPYAGFGAAQLVDIPHGVSTPVMAGLLEQRGVIRSSWEFLALRVIHPRARLQAGEYRFEGPAPSSRVFERIARGDVHHYEFTAPEGSNLFDIARIVARLGFVSESEFREAALDPSLVRDLSPQARTLEGYLFPSTYRVTRYTTAAQICRLMTTEFRAVWKQLASSGNVHHAVTLASLIEKETSRPEERPLVASVFSNRLTLGMNLDCDPTTIYAALLENRYRGVIHKSDLESKHPYNTYRHAGLPPGPISSPGRESLQAALAPAHTSYLFFVARPGAGASHQFSVTRADHERAVAQYRRGIKRTIQASPARPVPGRTKPARG